MSENLLPDYLEHIRQAATNARNFVDGIVIIVPDLRECGSAVLAAAVRAEQRGY
jgi:hypothetical protein